jgi:sugar phosphate isomerase/epimerase
LEPKTRRRFIAESAALAAGAWVWPEKGFAGADSGPNLHFPTAARERIAVASYPFRAFLTGGDEAPGGAGAKKMELKEFAAHVIAKFGVNKIEPWSAHFTSLDEKHLAELRGAVEKAGAVMVNIAVDGEHSPYAVERDERDKAVQISKRWVDVAAAVGARSIRTNIPPAKGSKADLERTADSLRRVAEYGATKNVVIHLENDNPASEDPFFLVQVLDKVNSPWLHALPDFANSLTAFDAEHAYNGINAMFAHAYGICHVKAKEVNDKGQEVLVDLAKTFGMLKANHYLGYCSMEFDSPGDPYGGTAELIERTVEYLS